MAIHVIHAREHRNTLRSNLMAQISFWMRYVYGWLKRLKHDSPAGRYLFGVYISSALDYIIKNVKATFTDNYCSLIVFVAGKRTKPGIYNCCPNFFRMVALINAIVRNVGERIFCFRILNFWKLPTKIVKIKQSDRQSCQWIRWRHWNHKTVM